MKLRNFIKNTIMIALILAVVFLSQQPNFGRYGNGLYPWIREQSNNYGSKLSNWFTRNIYPKVGGEVEKGKGAIESELVKQKDNAAKNIWGKFKNYFAEKFSKIFGTKVE